MSSRILNSMIAMPLRAVTIPVNEVAGVAGFVKPDDRVDVVLTSASEGGGSARVLLQNMRVLAVAQTATNENEEPQVVSTVTLEANPTEAKKLILASQVGAMSLVLRSNEDGGRYNDRPMTVGQLFVDSGPQPEPTAEDPTPVVDPLASISIIRGLSSSTTSVPKE